MGDRALEAAAPGWQRHGGGGTGGHALHNPAARGARAARRSGGLGAAPRATPGLRASGRAGGRGSAPLPHPPARGSLTFRAAPGHHARAQPPPRASRAPSPPHCALSRGREGRPGRWSVSGPAEPHHAARPTLPQSRRAPAPPPLSSLPRAPGSPSRPCRGRPAPIGSHSPGAAHARCSRPARGDPGPALLSRRRPRGGGGVAARGGGVSASAARDRVAGWLAGRGRRGPGAAASTRSLHASRRGRGTRVGLADLAAATRSPAPPRRAPPGLPSRRGGRGCRD